MKQNYKYILFTIITQIFITQCSFASNDDNWVYFYDNEKYCDIKNFDYKKISEININSKVGIYGKTDGYLIHKNAKFEISDATQECSDFQAKNRENLISLLPNKCSFYIGTSCINLENNEYKNYQFQCDKNECKKLKSPVEYE